MYGSTYTLSILADMVFSRVYSNLEDYEVLERGIPVTGKQVGTRWAGFKRCCIGQERLQEPQCLVGVGDFRSPVDLYGFGFV